MTIGLRSGDDRCMLGEHAECIKGWRHLHALASMEGRLMVIAAAQRARGHLTESERNEIAFTGIEFVRAGYSVGPALNASCRMLAASVEQLAIQIDEREWIWAVDYESGAWHLQQVEDDDEICTDSICLEGIRYQLVPHRSNSIDARVYVQQDVTGSGHFRITERDTGKQVAILPEISIAKHVASYAVSTDGGYGDVIIGETSEKPTHMSATEWLLG
ncbi:hypothetical protein [Pantoea vagans]|uniref:hypothetical protein n=1 Tax=Pantoea vagans TaxID=470934 RepID=UPI0023B1053C|nr:hypothetical protein [Pantoea vagans]MDE8558962.1 hypothetical protein [Pantoea vagans]MDE8578967.1 hypothetical protein [Pantoea vagans]